MYKQLFHFRRQVLVFRHFGNKGYSLFACLGREVVCSVLSVATLTYASAESVSTDPVVTDSASMTTAREMMLEEVPIGAQTDISIRGGTSEQIIILLNGINICDPQTGHNVMDLPIDLSEIVRIEVLEGPAGRIYGTSSLVGAINIVTKRPLPTSPIGEEKLHLRIEGGSFGYASAATRISLPPYKEGWRGSLSASYSRSDGYSRSKAGTLNTDFSGSKAFYQGQYEDDDVSIHWHLGIADKGWGSSTFYASPRWQADDQYEHTTKLFSAIQGATKRGQLHFSPSIYWNQNRDRYEGYRGQPSKMAYNYNRTDVYGVNLSSYFDWVAGRTAFGAELRNEDLVSGNLGEPLSQTHHISGTDRDYTLGVNRTNISGYLEHNLLFRRFTLSAGLVAVKNTWSNMNMTVYPGIDVSYRPNDHWKLHASYNTSLRMPSFTEMYYKLQGYSADPHLKPEEMQALEIGFNTHYSIFNLQCTLWHHHGTNMIDWIMDTSKGDEAVWQSVNHTEINSIGVELSSEARFQKASARLSYSYINQDKKQEENIVSQYALEYLRHKLVGNLRLQLTRRLDLGLTARWQDRVGSYTDFDGHVQDYRPYFLTDARLTWKQDHWKAYIEANNLFDVSYHDYGLVEQPGRWIIVGFNIGL